MVSVLDSGAVGSGFKSLSSNSLRQTIHTHRASVHQAAKLVAALLRVAGVTAGLAESNGISYRYGFTKEIFHIQTIIDSVTYDPLYKVKASNHCLYHLLPPQRPLHDALRVTGHPLQLPMTAYTNFTSNLSL